MSKLCIKTAKSSESYKLFGYSKRNNPYETALIDLICGRKVKFSDMFGDKSFDSEEVNGNTVISYKKSLNLSKKQRRFMTGQFLQTF